MRQVCGYQWSGDKGAFKTPTIRDVALRAPYMHNGSEKDLEAGIDLYNKGGRMKDANLDPLISPEFDKKRKGSSCLLYEKSHASKILKYPC